MSIARTLTLTAALLSAGCYHATVTTGAAPSLETIEQPFASSWIYGLVPPKTVEAAEKCSSGVAKVETQQSFLNGLVGVLTFGIYTPMNIKVTCAAKTTAMTTAESVRYLVPRNDEVKAREVITAAASEAFARGEPVVLEVAR
jgi:hypothetical protein